MKTNVQVEVFLFQRTPELRVALFKRSETRGGFWQPITGAVEIGEGITGALRREVGEEAGVKDLRSIVEIGYSFCFAGEDGRPLTEFVYGAEVESPNIVCSAEHTESRWVTIAEALTLLKWPNNKEALRALERMVGR